LFFFIAFGALTFLGLALAVEGFLGAACFFEECFTTKNNWKNSRYLIKCLP
jgi:hypothetical protein